MHQLDNLLVVNVTTRELLPFGETKIIVQKGIIDVGLNRNERVIGIDPGQVHMGVAILRNRRFEIFEIELPSKQPTVPRLETTSALLDYLFSLSLPMHVELRACVEQAAFGFPFGQVPLAESRTAAIFGLLKRGVQPIVAPPASIRKAVFGSGKQKAEEFPAWGELLPNAASSLACALFVLVSEKKNETG